MRVPPVYGSTSDLYTWQNNFLNNSRPEVGGECEFHAYTGVRHTFIHGKKSIQIIPNHTLAGNASSTHIRERVRRLYKAK